MEPTLKGNEIKLKSTQNDFLISGTTHTPLVKYKASKGILMIRGFSIEMDMHKFYDPIITHIKSELSRLNKMELYFDLEDMNTSTAKILFNLFNFLRIQRSKGSDITIFWKASNPEMTETALDYAEFTGLNFNVRSLNKAA